MEEKKGFIFFMIFILTFFLVMAVSDSTTSEKNNKKSTEIVKMEAILPKSRKKDTIDPILEDELDLPKPKRNLGKKERSAPTRVYP